MAELVNLRQARKRRDRDEAEKAADANRAKFGRTKAERAATKSEKDRQATELAGKRLEKGK